MGPHLTSRANYLIFNIGHLVLLCYLVFISSVVCTQTQDTFTSIPSKILNDHIKTNSSWIGPLVASNIVGNRFVLDITVLFAKEKCCPQFLLLTEAKDDTLLQDGCLNMSPEMHQAFHLASKQFIGVNQSDLQNTPDRFSVQFSNRNTTCIYQRHTGMYNCRFSHVIYSSTPRNASVYAYYPCFNRNKMDIIVDISLQTESKSFQCTDVQKSLPCSGLYHFWNLPNIIGAQETKDAEGLFTIFNLISSTKCHQHVLPFSCRAFFPECTSNGSILPCKSMCLEIMLACSDYAHPRRSGVRVQCRFRVPAVQH